MTGQQLLTLIGAIGVPTLVTVLLNFLSNRQTLKRSAPKTDAEVDEINNRVQNQVITNLKNEIERLGKKADNAVIVAEAAELKADGRETAMKKVLSEQRAEFERSLEEMRVAHKKETDELRAQIKQLTAHIRDTETGNNNSPSPLPE